MRPAPRLLLTFSAALLAACAQAEYSAPAPISAAARAWWADVSAMANAGPDAGRRTAIQHRLDRLDIDWRSSPFELSDEQGQYLRQGENLLADVAGAPGAPLLLIGAHSDRVDAGHGATDNASGSATVLALAERFKQRPLANHRVAIAFWDLEELGLKGARAFVSEGGTPPALYVNLDVFGWGDTLWMMTPDTAHPLVVASQTASRDAGLQLSAGEQYPPTDHRAFLEAGWPAVSYSLVGSDEITPILEAYAGRKPATMPKLMQVIHSTNDTLAHVDPNAAARAVDALEDALRRWDASLAVAAATR